MDKSPTYVSEHVIGHACAHVAKAASTHSVGRHMAGRLHRSNGQLVLTVPSDFIRGAFDAVDAPGVELPPLFGVMVMSASELAKLDPDKITERGHQFTYTLGKLRERDTRRSPYTKVVEFTVSSPDLERLRHSYGLSAHPYGDTFTLPIAVRKSGVLHHNDVVKASNHDGDPDWIEFDPNSLNRQFDPDQDVKEANRMPLPVISMDKSADYKVRRDAFLYSDPKEPRDDFAQCRSCMMWTGAKRQRCTIHGPDVLITGKHACALYVHGKPHVDMAGKEETLVSPDESGLVDREVRCENCKFVDMDDPSGTQCKLFAKLNEAVPEIFSLDPNIDSYGCCSAQTPKQGSNKESVSAIEEAPIEKQRRVDRAVKSLARMLEPGKPAPPVKSIRRALSRRKEIELEPPDEPATIKK